MIKETIPPPSPKLAERVPATLRPHLARIHDYTLSPFKKTIPENIKSSGDQELVRSLQLISNYLSLPILEDNFVDKNNERNYREDVMEEDARKEWERNMLRANAFTPVHDAIDILGGRPEVGEHIKTREHKDVFVRNGYYLAEFRDVFHHEPATTMEQKRGFDVKKKAFVQEYSQFIAEVFDAAVEAFSHA